MTQTAETFTITEATNGRIEIRNERTGTTWTEQGTVLSTIPRSFTNRFAARPRNDGSGVVDVWEMTTSLNSATERQISYRLVDGETGESL